MSYIVSLLCGILFGCGLTISNMIDANKILNFLDITGNWDPSLLFVMLSALIVTWIGYHWVMKWTHPRFAEKFFLPEKKSLDPKLISGSILFGIGWGLAGYCPGPAITALGLGIMDAIYFMSGMVISLFIYHAISLFSRWREIK
jgi:uncharacterized membrane protein YedE/YeeE